MKRYEALITKDWRAAGVASVLVSRIDDNGSVTAGFFLVDPLCLGVKDAFLRDDLTEGELREVIARRFAEDTMERMHPAWAKKFIEGAVAYAENLGLAPHHDYRKARRALSGIDAEMCTETFVYGKDGRPYFVQGSTEDEERTARILAALDARVGPDGYTRTLREDVLDDPDISPEAVKRMRDMVETFLEKIKSDFTVHYVAGLITAMLCQPGAAFTVDDVMDILEETGDEDGNPHDKERLLDLRGLLEFYWAQIEALFDAEMDSSDPWPFDFYADDFADERQFVLAMIQWVGGFMDAVEMYEELWSEARALPELAQAWAVLKVWGDPMVPGGLIAKLQESASEAESGGGKISGYFDENNPRNAIVAIFRAVSPAA